MKAKYPPRAVRLVKEARKKAGCNDLYKISLEVEKIADIKRGKRGLDDYLSRQRIETISDIKNLIDLELEAIYNNGSED